MVTKMEQEKHDAKTKEKAKQKNHCSLFTSNEYFEVEIGDWF
jgi:hypothetical protein